MIHANSSKLAGRRILIVEDQYLLAMDLEAVLTEEGATVVGIAGNVARGLELLDETSPEAAVLDLNLKGENSMSLAAAFSERHIPFVVVTGYGESWSKYPQIRDAPRAEKPVDHKQLVRLLVDALADA